MVEQTAFKLKIFEHKLLYFEIHSLHVLIISARKEVNYGLFTSVI